MTTATPAPPRRATLDDLMRIRGKAELIGGKVVEFMASGRQHGTIALRIARHLADHVDATGVGEAQADNVGYAVPELPSGRETFSPDASYHTIPPQAEPRRFIDGPPAFAVEVRSENDYGPAAERAMADKRADYFAAGTRVVWDVDPEAGTVARYRADAPQTPVLFSAGHEADAEPAVPGWRLSVDWLLR